jgi:CRISPR-associated protein Cas1
MVVSYNGRSLALDLIEPFRQTIIDRFTLRLFNLRQFTEKDFEMGEKGCRLIPESFKRYLEMYETELEGASSQQSSPTWRDVIRQEALQLKEGVMKGEIATVYQWKDR